MALAAKARTVGSAPAPTQIDLVITAELMRGRVYWYKDQEFKKGEVVVVSNDLAEVLEGLHQLVTDREGESYEKPFFEVRRGVARPAPKTQDTTRKLVRRLSAR